MKLLERQVQLKWDPWDLASASSTDIADWTKTWEASEGRVGVSDDVEILLDRKILIPNSDGRFTFGVPNYYSTMVKKIPRVFLSHATKDGARSEALRKRLELRGVLVIAMEQKEAQVVMMEQSIPSWMDDHTTKKGQHSLFLLSDHFMEQLKKGDDASVERELSNAITAHKKHSCPKPIFACVGVWDSKYKDHDLLKDVDEHLVIRVGQRVGKSYPEEEALYRVLDADNSPLKFTN